MSNNQPTSRYHESTKKCNHTELPVKISGVAMGMGVRHMCTQTPVSLFDDYCLFYCLFYCLSYCLSYCLFYCLFYCSFYCSSYCLFYCSFYCLMFILKLMLYPINNVSKQPLQQLLPLRPHIRPPLPTAAAQG